MREVGRFVFWLVIVPFLIGMAVAQLGGCALAKEEAAAAGAVSTGERVRDVQADAQRTQAAIERAAAVTEKTTPATIPQDKPVIAAHLADAKAANAETIKDAGAAGTAANKDSERIKQLEDQIRVLTERKEERRRLYGLSLLIGVAGCIALGVAAAIPGEQILLRRSGWAAIGVSLAIIALGALMDGVEAAMYWAKIVVAVAFLGALVWVVLEVLQKIRSKQESVVAAVREIAQGVGFQSSTLGGGGGS